MTWLWLTIFAPAFAAAGIWLGRRAAAPIGLGGIAVSLAASIFGAARYGGAEAQSALMDLGGRALILAIAPDTLTLSVIVAIISAFVFAYSIQYMKGEGRSTWFWGALSLFASAMQLLVFAGDWITFIMGWEVMGLASYLLIATHFEKAEARNGASKAFLLTRATDLGLYVGAFAIFVHYGSLEIRDSVTSALPALGAAGLIVAVMGKSAQVPFQSWLSGAMAGPTPASALLHSATMVAAGALLLIRAMPFFSEAALGWIIFIGGGTALLAGLSAIAARDLKQMLAASTSSQLGLMVLAIGLGSPGAAFGHWIAHAFIKSGLFLGAGVFQKSFESTSYRELGGTGLSLKLNYALFALLGLALTGAPPLIGYFSKDAIISAAYEQGVAYFVLALLGSAATALYIGRALRVLWSGASRPEKKPSLGLMVASLAVPVLCVIVGGFYLESLVSTGGHRLPKQEAAKAGGLAVLALGGLAGWFLYQRLLPERFASYSRNHYIALGGYHRLVARPVDALARIAARVEGALSEAVLQVGGLWFGMGQILATVDARLRTANQAVGVGGLRVSQASRKRVEDRVIAAVDAVAEGSRSLGQTARRWQSGLVHQELMITVIGTAAAVALFLVLAYTL